MHLLQKDSSKLSILIDIGSGSITTSLVLFQENTLPTFLYTMSQNFLLTEMLDPNSMLENMSSILSSSMLAVLKNGFQHEHLKSKNPKLYSAFISFSSPWFLQKSKQIEINENKSFVVTESFLNEVVAKEVKLFVDEIKKDHGNYEEDQFSIIESSILNIKVNGYVINKIVNQNINSLSAYLCLSLITTNVFNRVVDIISKNTHLEKNKIVTHSFPLVFFSVMRDLYSQYHSFILMDLTSEITSITLIRDDVVLGFETMPIGRNYIIRQIASEFDISVEIAESQLSLYSVKKLDAETTDKIEKVLLSIENEWSVYLENVLLHLSSKVELPNKLYLTCEKDVSELIKSYLKLQKTDTTATFRSKLDVTCVDENLLSSFYINDSHTPINEFVILIAAFYKKIIF